MRSLALLIPQSMIVLAFNETLGFPGPDREPHADELHSQYSDENRVVLAQPARERAAKSVGAA